MKCYSAHVFGINFSHSSCIISRLHSGYFVKILKKIANKKCSYVELKVLLEFFKLIILNMEKKLSKYVVNKTKLIAYRLVQISRKSRSAVLAHRALKARAGFRIYFRLAHFTSQMSLIFHVMYLNER